MINTVNFMKDPVANENYLLGYVGFCFYLIRKKNILWYNDLIILPGYIIYFSITQVKT